MITETFNKNSCGELIHLKHPHKSSQKFKATRTHHLPAFIPKHFSSKSTETPFGCYFLIIWLNESFFMPRCSNSSLVEKNGYRVNGETRNGDSANGSCY